MSKEQVVEAVIIFRDEDRDALAPRRSRVVRAIVQTNLHRKTRGDLRHRALDRKPVSCQIGDIEKDTLKKLTVLSISVLHRIKDVGTMTR
jgi:hypothetical protein